VEEEAKVIKNMKIESKKKKGVRKKLRNKMKRGAWGGGGGVGKEEQRG